MLGHKCYVVRPTGVYLLDFFCSDIQFYGVLIFALSPFLYLALYVLGDDAWMLGVFLADQTSMCLDPHLN